MLIFSTVELDSMEILGVARDVGMCLKSSLRCSGECEGTTSQGSKGASHYHYSIRSLYCSWGR